MLGLNSGGEKQFEVAVCSVVISTLVVTLRLFCKIQYKQGIRGDDYWIIGALLWLCAAAGVTIWGVIAGGGGKEAPELVEMIAADPSSVVLMENTLKSMFLSHVMATSATYAIKISILMFYRRIFFITKNYQRASLGVMIVATIWYITTTTISLTQCRPLYFFWTRIKPENCPISFSIFFLISSIFDTIIDVMILVLPLRMAFTLQLPMRTKVMVAGIFALGGFAVITNIIRMKAIYKPKTFDLKFLQAVLWTYIHMVTALVCACLPIYKQLWTSFSTVTGSWISRYTHSFRSSLGSNSVKMRNMSSGRRSQDQGSEVSLKSGKTDLESGLSKTMTEHWTARNTSVTHDDTESFQTTKGEISYVPRVNAVRAF